jgi:hypothetical protein
MKYVVLKHPTKLPVIVCGLMVTHDELIAGYRARGYEPTSAGFLRLAPGIETFGFSSRLNLTPDRGDAQLIAAMYEATLKAAPPLPPIPVSTVSTTPPNHV